MTHLVHVYGYAIVFGAVALQALGAPVPGTTALIAAALYAANTHALAIAPVIACAAFGAVLGASAGWLIGRRGGARALDWVAARWRRGPSRLAALRRELDATGALWLVIARFVTGLRNVAGLLAGASGMAFGRFLAATTLGAVAWATLHGLEFYFFGRALRDASLWVQVGLFAFGFVWITLGYRWARRRAALRVSR